MEKQPDIVPIQLDNQNDFDPITTTIKNLLLK